MKGIRMALRLVALGMFVSLSLWSGPASAVALPHPASDAEFGKPEWDLAMSLPDDWGVHDWGELVEISSNLDGEFAQILIISDAAYADLALDDLLADMAERSVLMEPGGTSPAEPRVIAGQEAESATFTAEDMLFGDPISGRLYRFTLDGQTFALWTVTADDNTMTFDAEFDLMLDSLQIGATPTATRPSRPTATRRAVPTRARLAATPTSAATATPIHQADSVRDDFSGDGGYLGAYFADDGYSEYVDGVYRLTVTGEESYIYGASVNQGTGSEPRDALPLDEAGGLVVDVDATWVSGSPRGRYGVACGFENGETFYALTISGDARTAAIFEIENLWTDRPADAPPASDWRWLDGGVFATPVRAIRVGPGERNHLQAACTRGGMALSVNGTSVAAVNLPGTPAGGIALVALNLGADNMVVEFDNLEVRRPEVEPAVTPMRRGQTIVRDDFSDQGSGWDVGSFDRGRVRAEYIEGTYHITLAADQVGWLDAMSPAYADVSAEVSIRLVAGDEAAFAGIMVRKFRDVFYDVVINGRGEYSVGKQPAEGDFQFLVDWTPSEALNTSPGMANRLRVDAVGDLLTVYLNGKKVEEVRDADLAVGYLQLEASSSQAREAEFAFDNLILRKP